ncbi:MAG TPA: hypothetical protein VJ890_27220 [Vineibacter sp.]|nr:hypothetical protein [Vineibacter sp.]
MPDPNWTSKLDHSSHARALELVRQHDGRRWHMRIGHVTVMPQKRTTAIRRSIEESELAPLSGKIADAIRIAGAMAKEAVAALLAYKTVGVNSIGDFNGIAQRDPGLHKTATTLLKYFDLDPRSAFDAPGTSNVEPMRRHQYWSDVDSICRNYSKINSGLAENYEIVVFLMLEGNPSGAGLRIDSRSGFVSPQWRGGVQPAGLDASHIPWEKVEDMGRIHININYLVRDTVGSDDLARVIVHEASHKFARTNDVLYKHETPFNLYKDGQQSAANPPTKADLHFNVLVDPDLARGAKLAQTLGGRSIAPFSGLDRNNAPIAASRWILNADSYAWAARRMWKGTKA